MDCSFSRSEGLVELAHRCRRLFVEAEAESTRTIVGRLQQIVHLPEWSLAKGALDDQTTPIVWRSIAERTEDSVEEHRLVQARSELELHRIELDRAGSGQVAPAIDEAPKRNARTIGAELIATRGYRLRLARQCHVDVAAARLL